MARIEDISDYDVLWLGVDRRDCLGAFITAGLGPVPVEFLEDCITLIENVEVIIMSLPDISECNPLSDLYNSPAYVNICKKGIFVFDWTDLNRPKSRRINAYEKVCSPDSPIKYAEIQNNFAGNFQPFTWKGAEFSRSEKINPLFV